MLVSVLFVLWLVFGKWLTLCYRINRSFTSKTKARYVQPCCKPNCYVRNRKKPQWVIDKVIYLKAVSGYGCGKVAETFNRIHGERETVSKSFIYEKLKNHQYQLMQMKRQIRNKPPRKVPINQTWAMDLTTVTLNKQQNYIYCTLLLFEK